MSAPVATTFGGLIAAGIWSVFGMIVVAIVRQIGPWRKQSIDAAQKFRDELLDRIKRLENEAEESRKREVLVRNRHEAERALDRHKFSNLGQCFDALIMLLESNPDKVLEIVPRIKEMRAEQIKAEALEKSAIYAAALDSTGGLL